MLFGPSGETFEGEVDALTGDDQIDYVDGLMAHLGPPPLEGMEDKYGQEGLQNKGGWGGGGKRSSNKN